MKHFCVVYVSVISEQVPPRAADPHILLGKHTLDGAAWRLPGGLLDRAELPADAASRILQEETNIAIPAQRLRFIDHKIVSDTRCVGPDEPRMLGHLYQAHIDHILIEPGYDMSQVDWFRLQAARELLARDLIIPDHRELLQKSLERYATI